jgi:hypothetical protein
MRALVIARRSSVGFAAGVATLEQSRLRAAECLVRVMRSQGWDIGCRDNQETPEELPLYFSQFKTSDPCQLAAEIRRWLDQTNSQ